MAAPTRIATGLTIVLACACTATAQDTSTAPPQPGPPTLERSWTASIRYPVLARRTPGGRVVARLRHDTDYSRAQSVFMVTEVKDVDGKRWIRVQLHKRPNGSQGWVPAETVALRSHTTWIRISNGRRTVTVFRAGKRIKRYRAAVGTGGTPTPRGLFAVYDRFPTGGQLGPIILVLTAHSNVLRTFAGGDGTTGIHGWPSSAVLGKAVSNGCVRMSRADVRELARYAKTGVPVEIVK